MKITKILAREIYNSQGQSTLQCDVELDNKYLVSASVPHIKSNKSFNSIIENIEKVIAPNFLKKEPNSIDMDLKLIELDGTLDKSNLGFNTLLAVSMAIYRAESFSKGIELFELIAQVMNHQTVTLPFPMFSIINGGVNANNNLNIKEFLIVPIATPTFRSSLEIAINIFSELENYLRLKNVPICFGQKGGFVCGFKNDQDALDILSRVIDKINKKNSISCFIALDIAASFYYIKSKNIYNLNNRSYTSKELIKWYKELTDLYPIYSIEDGMAQSDIKGWKELYSNLHSKVQVIGDNIFDTNVNKIEKFIQNNKITDGIIIKPNQVGTITETLQVIKLCKEKRLNTIVSVGSGDTEDNFISDLAVGAQLNQIEAGGLRGTEHLCKYNRLLAIEDFLSLSLFDA